MHLGRARGYDGGVAFGYAVKTLVTALAAFHADVGKITKASKAQYGLYANLATVLDAVTGPLSAQGLIVTQTFTPWDGGYTILRTTLAHSSGESIVSEVVMPLEANPRNQLHSFGAACTYLRRYALLAILNLAAEDDDGESFGSSSTQKPAARSTSPSKAPSRAAAAIAAPPAPVPAPAPAPEPAPAPAPAPAAPSELSREERAELLTLVKNLDPLQRDELLLGFRTQFNLSPEHKVSDYIKATEHADFILSRLNGALSPA